ncbi:MAG: hypothetical protein GX442_10355 [Candidatus Riflebacteria bacterium]|nr:hypothetical protein [Candidatus Riflebacteria bacterium]
MRNVIRWLLVLGLCVGCGVAWADAPLEGFDQRKLDNPDHKTPKYLFARVARTYPLDSVHDKVSAERLLMSMRQDLRDAGLRIRAIKGDRILVLTEIGWEWVDVICRAGGENPAYWWGSEGKPTTDLPPAAGDEPGPDGDRPPSSGGGQPPKEPGEALETVPMLPGYADVPIDTSSDRAAITSTATWVKEHHPDLFVEGDDRDKAYVMMTHVIGIMRAHGYDAHRVVNHPSRPVGNPWRYGSDALVINGYIFDCYAGLGDLNMSRPQALYVGPYAAGRLRE